MVSHPHGHAVVVEDLTQIVGMDPVDEERDGRTAIDSVGGADDPDAVDAGEALERAVTSRCSCAATASMPMFSRYFTAAPSPTTCDVIGTPASKRCGGGA